MSPALYTVLGLLIFIFMTLSFYFCMQSQRSLKRSLFFLYVIGSVVSFIGIVFLIVYIAKLLSDFSAFVSPLVPIVQLLFLSVLILFQKEVRALFPHRHRHGSEAQGYQKLDQFLEALSSSLYRMAEKRLGAIVLLERRDNLEPFAQNGIYINSAFSPELLESIFCLDSPLHDGAMIIRGSTIVAARCILPLSKSVQHHLSFTGTRHLAGAAVGEFTDALAIVLSEETGQISVIREGTITRNIRIDQFKGIVYSLFNTKNKKKNVSKKT